MSRCIAWPSMAHWSPASSSLGPVELALAVVLAWLVVSVVMFATLVEALVMLEAMIAALAVVFAPLAGVIMTLAVLAVVYSYNLDF